MSNQLGLVGSSPTFGTIADDDGYYITKVSVPGHKPRTTQFYLRGGEKAIRFDMVVEADQGDR